MLDIIFLLLLSVMMMFVILLSILRTKAHDPAVENRNNYVIQMEWTEFANVDIDMWLLGPNMEFVSYKQKEAPGLFLQRDDLGSSNDAVRLTDGTWSVSGLNQEIINIRQWVPGRYYVNAHVYKSYQKEPVSVKMTLIRVNPFEEYKSQEYELSYVGQEETLLTFDIAEDGKLTMLPPVTNAFIEGRKAELVRKKLVANPHGTGAPITIPSPDDNRDGE